MPDQFVDLKGWAKHQYFGLRTEWVRLYLEEPVLWRVVGHLGPDQVTSLAEWVVTAGMVDRSGTITAVGRAMAAGIATALEPWQLVWVEMIFNWVTPYWYASLGFPVDRSTRDLKTELQEHVPRLSTRTVSNVVTGLVGTLERTPIGPELGQGIVSPTTPRTVRRVGLASPSPEALAHAMRRLFIRERRLALGLGEDLMWPWIVFGCDREEALWNLAVNQRHWLDVDSDTARLLIPWEELHGLPLF